MARRYSGEHLKFFFRIFRPYPAPAVKTRFYLLKNRETFLFCAERWEKRNLLISVINTITLSDSVFQFLGQTRKFKKKIKKRFT